MIDKFNISKLYLKQIYDYNRLVSSNYFERLYKVTIDDTNTLFMEKICEGDIKNKLRIHYLQHSTKVAFKCLKTVL